MARQNILNNKHMLLNNQWVNKDLFTGNAFTNTICLHNLVNMVLFTGDSFMNITRLYNIENLCSHQPCVDDARMFSQVTKMLAWDRS